MISFTRWVAGWKLMKTPVWAVKYFSQYLQMSVTHVKWIASSRTTPLLAANSTIFKRYEAEQAKEMTVEKCYNEEVLYKVLKIMSGIVDTDEWSIE